MVNKVVKYNNKIVYFILIVIISIFMGAFILFSSAVNNDKIRIVLESDSYAYLPSEAKNFVQDVYAETGEVVLTEKNKKENEPYLNPKYIIYLSLPAEERENVEVIPDAFLIDYVSDSSNTSVPSLESVDTSFDLRDIDGKSYVTPLKNQSTLGVCWAMSTVEVAESFLMLKNNAPYNKNTTEVFSVRQIDYATSTDGLIYNSIFSTSKAFENKKFGHRSLGSGGWLWQAAVVGGNGILLTDESVLPWNTKKTKIKADSILNYNNSRYEFDSTIRMPNISYSSTVEDKNNFILEVKDYITKYGGAWVSTGSPQGSCAFENNSSDYVIVDNTECASDSDYGFHAMQIIGWDDEYSYAYCDNGTTHLATNSNSKCSSGTYVEGKGAWILRNSWGESSVYAYPYLAYDSVDYEVEFISSLSHRDIRNWDNNYFDNFYDFETGQMYYATSFENSFSTGINNEEKIEKMKFYSFLSDVTYTITISSPSLKNNYIKTFVSHYPGLYTIDISSDNLVISDSFNVEIEANKRYALLNNSTSVFTSNVSSEPLLETTYSNMAYDTSLEPSQLNPVYVKDTNVNMIFEHSLKNIPAGEDIVYKVLNGNVDVTSDFFVSGKINNMYLDNYVYSEAKVSSNTAMCGNTFEFQVLFNDKVLDSFPVKRICNSKNTTSNIRFYSNDGSDRYIDLYKEDLDEIVLISNNLNVPNEEIVGLSEWFDDNKFIESWNTKPDGTGVSYSDNELMVYSDLDLFAQWSTPHKYNLRYICSTCSGSGKEESVEYNKPVIITTNSFTKTSSKFLHWIDNSNNIYYEEEIVSDLVDKTNPYNNEYFDFTAVFVSNTYAKKITFDANGGVGTMSSINVKSKTASRLKYNLFSKDGYLFYSWNTKTDGSGVTYMDGDIINTNTDMILYAQWIDDFKIKVNDYVYDEEELMIKGIPPKTSIDDFISKITTNVIYDAEFDKSKEFVYTGSKIKLFYNDKLESEIITVVSGDTNGDGTLSIFDIVKINNHIINDKNKLDGIYSLAGDFDNDGTLSIFDIVKINNKILEAK